MKIDVFDLDGKKKKSIDLPAQFNEAYEADLVKRAVIAVQNSKRQAYGPEEDAGMKASSYISKRRRNYRTSYGKGISRIPRKIMWKRGMQLGWTAATSPAAVGGRRAHPPLVEKIFADKINKKEKSKAMRTILSGLVANKKIIAAVSDFESIGKTKEVKKILENFGLKEELKRVSEDKIRVGKGKLRGRRLKTKMGPLIVVGDECKLTKSGRNLHGCRVVSVNSLNAAIVASRNGRLRQVVFTENAIEKIEREKLFLR